jgi:hypothetical protein
MERVEELEVATWWTTKSSSPNRTEFLVGYKKRPDEPYLVLTRSWLNPTVMCPEVSPSFEPKPSQQLSRRHANLDGSCNAVPLHRMRRCAESVIFRLDRSPPSL